MAKVPDATDATIMYNCCPENVSWSDNGCWLSSKNCFEPVEFSSNDTTADLLETRSASGQSVDVDGCCDSAPGQIITHIK